MSCIKYHRALYEREFDCVALNDIKGSLGLYAFVNASIEYECSIEPATLETPEYGQFDILSVTIKNIVVFNGDGKAILECTTDVHKLVDAKIVGIAQDFVFSGAETAAWDWINFDEVEELT